MMVSYVLLVFYHSYIQMFDIMLLILSGSYIILLNAAKTLLSNSSIKLTTVTYTVFTNFREHYIIIMHLLFHYIYVIFFISENLSQPILHAS